MKKIGWIFIAWLLALFLPSPITRPFGNSLGITSLMTEYWNGLRGWAANNYAIDKERLLLENEVIWWGSIIVWHIGYAVMIYIVMAGIM